MSGLTFGEFLLACGGSARGRPLDANAALRPSTDTRSLRAGETFVCLRGPNFDGHDFIERAVAAGCGAVLVDDLTKVPAACPVPAIVVPDAKEAYLCGATAARRRVAARVIAITGSNGKTTTKTFAAQLIGRARRVLATPQNENNELGVAKLCYALDDSTEVAVVEFGSRKPGDIAQLVEIAKPDIGVLTNVGEAHLEFFPSVEALAREKFAIYGDGARPACSVADRWSRMLAAEAGVAERTIWARLVGDPQAPGLVIEAGTPADERVPLSMGASHAFARWSIAGEHHLRDALLAAAAALLAGLTFEEAVDGFGDLSLPPGRFEQHRLPSGAVIVFDAYNASPTSVAQSLQAFAALRAARHIAVLGSMAELGADAPAQHERTGAAAAQCKMDLLYCGGEYARALAEGAVAGGMRAAAVASYESNAQMIAELREILRSGDAVLLKGSRVQKMEEILGALVPPKAHAS